MNKIIRYFNQNRRQIILGIAILVSIIVIIQILNQIAKVQMEEKNKLVQENTEDLSQLPTQSIITGEIVNKENTESNVELIQNFIIYCNEKKTREAYDMLTEECKKALFTTEEEFIKGYYNIIFTQKKLYGIENFRNLSGYYTYEVKFYNDALATGKIQDSDIYQDYITIDKKQAKLNINSFIMEREFNKKIEEHGIEITIFSKEVYKEYEKYNISVKNNTEKTILMDSGESSKNVYAVGDDNGKYNSFINEIANNLLRIEKGITRKYELKINKIYNPAVTIESICFADIITYEENDKGENERLKIVIDL